jgi:hypothetical protein
MVACINNRAAASVPIDCDELELVLLEEATELVDDEDEEEPPQAASSVNKRDIPQRPTLTAITDITLPREEIYG